MSEAAVTIINLDPDEETPNIKTENHLETDHAFNTEICRLCLGEISDNSHALLDGVTKDMLEIIMPELNTTISISAVVCQPCSITLQQTYAFKSTCLENEEKIQEYLYPNCSTAMSLEDVICNKELAENGFYSRISEDKRICRTCLKTVEHTACTIFNNLDGDPLKDMIEKCMPEMIITLTKEPAICSTCLESLEDQFHFLMQCLDVDEKIYYYREKFKCEGRQIDLHEVYRFSNEVEEVPEPGPAPELEEVEHNIIKQETQDHESLKGEDIVEENEVFIKKELIPEYPEEDEDEPLLSVTSVVDVVEDRNNVVIKKEKEYPKSKINYKEMDDDEDDDQNANAEEAVSDDDYCPYSKKQRSYSCRKCKFKSKSKLKLNQHILVSHVPDDKATKKPETVVANEPEKTTPEITVKQEEPDEAATEPPKPEKKRPMSFDKSFRSIRHCKDVECKFRTKDKCLLRRHMKTAHPNMVPLDVYSCPNCPEAFLRKGNYDKHLTSCKKLVLPESKKLPVQNSCQYGFKQSYRLPNRHLLTMYKCKICPYQSFKKSNFDRHSKIHKKSNEIKVHKCKDCNFETVKIETYNEHLKSHTDVKTENGDSKVKKCFICGYETKRIDLFKKHMVVHKTATKLVT